MPICLNAKKKGKQKENISKRDRRLHILNES